MTNLFEDLIGQPLAVDLLTAALKQQRLAPAYLFAGPDGVGRRLAAVRFLEGVLGAGQPAERQRRRLEERNHPDLLWVEPTFQHQGRLLTREEAEEVGISRRTPPQLRLEQVRSISRFLARQPVEAERGMVVIEAVEAMPEAAANALLKTLEEPGHGLLILLSAAPERLLSTIRSRCQLIRFLRLAQADLNRVLEGCGAVAEHDPLPMSADSLPAAGPGGSESCVGGLWSAGAGSAGAAGHGGWFTGCSAGASASAGRLARGAHGAIGVDAGSTHGSLGSRQGCV